MKLEKLGITKCPWRELRLNGNYMLFGGDKSKNQCHIVMGVPSNYDHMQPDESNARLIATAPEMLEALIEINIVFEKDGRFKGTVPEIAKLIEKATNRSWEEVKEVLGL